VGHLNSRKTFSSRKVDGLLSELVVNVALVEIKVGINELRMGETWTKLHQRSLNFLEFLRFPHFLASFYDFSTFSLRFHLNPYLQTSKTNRRSRLRRSNDQRRFLQHNLSRLDVPRCDIKSSEFLALLNSHRRTFRLVALPILFLMFR
jgi:hypothetical protein